MKKIEITEIKTGNIIAADAGDSVTLLTIVEKMKNKIPDIGDSEKYLVKESEIILLDGKELSVTEYDKAQSKLINKRDAKQLIKNLDVDTEVNSLADLKPILKQIIKLLED